MHLSMDTLGIVDDSCLDNYDMAKGAGSSNGGRVHSIDVILGFTKDQDPLLHSVGDDDGQKANGENPQHPQKQIPSDPYRHLSELGDSSQNSSYHGESFEERSDQARTLSNTSLDHFGDFLLNCIQIGNRAVLSKMVLFVSRMSSFERNTPTWYIPPLQAFVKYGHLDGPCWKYNQNTVRGEEASDISLMPDITTYC